MPAPWQNGYQARICGRIHGQETVNVLHFADNTVVADDPDEVLNLLIALANALFECVVDTLLPAVSQDWTFTKVDVRRVYPTPSQPFEKLATTPNVGELGVTSVSFAASLMSLQSVLGGRHGRGRMFLPPAGEAQTAVSEIDGPTLALLAAFAACLVTKFVGGGATEPYIIGILSRTQAGPTNATFDAGFHPAASITPKPFVSVMRSRRIGHGN